MKAGPGRDDRSRGNPIARWLDAPTIEASPKHSWACCRRRGESGSSAGRPSAPGCSCAGSPATRGWITPGPEVWAPYLLRPRDRSSGARPRQCCFRACCVSPRALAPEGRRQGCLGRSVRPGGAEVSADGDGVLVLVRCDHVVDRLQGCRNAWRSSTLGVASDRSAPIAHERGRHGRPRRLRRCGGEGRGRRDWPVRRAWR